MILSENENKKEEKIDGKFYDMSPSPNYRHGVVNGNIYACIKNKLKDSLCLVFMENLDYKYNAKESDDYVIPDVMIVCDRKYLKGGSYSGVPKFIVETLSPATAMKDKTIKKDIYEKTGVSEYWIVSPKERGIEIYYLENEKYKLAQSYILEEDSEDKHYNAKTMIELKEFPNVNMTLEEIFAGTE